MQDRAAARGDRVDAHHRRAHPDAGDLGLERAFVLAIEMRDVGGRAAHVEADHAIEAGALARARHRDDAARRSRENRVLAREQVRRGEPARGHHEHQPRAGAGDVEFGADARDVARQDRREIGVDHGRVAAPDQLDQRRAFVADRDLRETDSARDFADLALMLGIAVGVHEDDCDGVEALALGVHQVGADGVEVRRRLDRSVGEHAFGDFDNAGIELLRLDNVAREDFWPRLVADLQRVAKAACRHQQGALAAPLQQRVGGDGGPHLDEADRIGRDRGAGGQIEEVADRLHRRVGIGGALGQELADMEPPFGVAADHIGERPAAVDPEVPALACHNIPLRGGATFIRRRERRHPRPARRSGSDGLALRVCKSLIVVSDMIPSVSVQDRQASRKHAE